MNILRKFLLIDWLLYSILILGVAYIYEFPTASLVFILTMTAFGKALSYITLPLFLEKENFSLTHYITHPPCANKGNCPDHD
jgi:hypothetical protein